MATLPEIHHVLFGFPQALTWGRFQSVSKSPSPPHLAQTSSTFHMGSWRAALEKGAYRVRGFQIHVSVNHAASWATTTGRTAALLHHEQGHFDITGLVARDLARNLLDLSFDASVVTAIKGSGNTPRQRVQWAQHQFQRSVDELGTKARDLLAKLQTDPVTHADGIYDRQTGHGQDQVAQSVWDGRLSNMKQGNEDFGLALTLAGVL